MQSAETPGSAGAPLRAETHRERVARAKDRPHEGWCAVYEDQPCSCLLHRVFTEADELRAALARVEAETLERAERAEALLKRLTDRLAIYNPHDEAQYEAVRAMVIEARDLIRSLASPASGAPTPAPTTTDEP